MSQPTTKKTRLWRDELQDPLAPPRRRSRGVWIFAVLALMLGLIGVFAGMVFWLRPAPRPLFVPLWVSGYKAVQIPPVPFATQDQQALSNGRFFRNEKSQALSTQQGQQILATLRELEDESQPVVIYLCAQA